MRPKFLCIDGLDATGKKTNSQKIAKELTKRGKKVLIMDSPFYKSLAGQLVSEYLKNGYKCMRDRVSISALYSIDRNMYLRKHFDTIMSGDFDYVIMNRWTITNLFFNTTMELQEEGSAVAKPAPSTVGSIPVPPSIGSMYDFDASDGMYSLTLADMHKMMHGKLDIQFNTERDRNEVEGVVKFLYPHLRKFLVRDHANFLYRLENAHWVAPAGIEWWLPFTTVQYLFLSTSNPDILTQNLMKRYEGDASKMDINEASLKYLLSVAENVHWIERNYDNIFNSCDLNSNHFYWNMELYKNCRLQPIVSLIQVNPIKSTVPRDVFSFESMDIMGKDGVTMNPVNTMCRRIWNYFHLNEEVGMWTDE